MPSGDTIIIGRGGFIQEVLRIIARRESIHIKAGEGMGKTTLLQQLKPLIPNCAYTRASTKKEILKRLCEEMKINTHSQRVYELQEQILTTLESNYMMLLIDDSDELTNKPKRIIKKLMNQGLVIITIGEKNHYRLIELTMPKLKNEEIKLIIKYYLKDPPDELVKQIINETETPQELINALRRAPHHNLKSNEGVNTFLDSIRKHKKELLPVAGLAIIITLMLSLRYYFYMQREFQMGYTVALIAYVLRALNAGRKK